ncbi:RrF2 family transcriptional regulator [Anaerovoracaceae bacterium SGI.195]
MQLNQTTDYAVRILVFLSRKNDFVSSHEISKETKVTRNYTRKILRTLTSRNLIKIKRGVNGGYKLNKPAGQITLFEIFTAMEKSININPCLDNDADCTLYGNEGCHVKRYYTVLQQEFEEKIKDMTIEKLETF